MDTREKLEEGFESVLFASRWLMAPFYLGLIAALAALLFVFLRALLHEIGMLPEINAEGAILMALMDFLARATR